MPELSVLKFNMFELPKFVEKKSNGIKWVLCGEKNDYFDYLIQLFNSSPKHGAIVRAKARYITGNGWSINEDGLTVAQLGEVQKFLSEPNPLETLADVKQGVVLDDEIFSAFALQIVWGKASKKIAEIYHVPLQRLRCNAEATEYYYTKNWKATRPNMEKDFKVYPKFDPENPKGTQILYVVRQSPKESGNDDVYTYPSYVNCIPYIETDAEIANYHLNNIKNGFMASTMIKFYNGIPTSEEQRELERAIQKKLTGSQNAGRFILAFSNDKDHGSEIEKLQPTDFDKQFLQLNEAVQQEIFTVHQITSPMLFGIRVAGQLGGRTELLEAWQLFKNNYILPKAQEIDKVFNSLLAINGLPKCLRTVPMAPVNLSIPDILIAGVITPNEARASLDLPPLDDPEADKLAGGSAPKPTAFSKHNDTSDIEVFRKYGRPVEQFLILKEKPMRFSSEVDLLKSELDLLEFAVPLDINVDTLEGKVYQLIGKGKTPKEIAKELKVPEAEVNSAIASLKSKGHISEVGGLPVIPEKPSRTIDISVAYKYDVAPGLGDLIIPTTREFCREVIGMNRIYTRREIEQISAEVGYSVWRERGGFYTNPKTGETTPYCRHIWKQVVVKKIT